jgi:hypothetical protein
LKVWIAKEEDDTEARKKNGRLVVSSSKSKKGNMTFVKFTVLGNGEGILGDLVCYVAIPNLGEEDFLACWVPGLCHTNNLGGGGWMLFMKKRTGNLKSHRWLHTQYLVPTIAKGDAMYTHPSFVGLKAALQIDGEAPILQVAMEPDVQKAYHDADITGTKGPPNCTGRDQLMDVAPIFMNTHSGVAKVSKECTDVSNGILKNGLEVAFKLLKDNYPKLPQITKLFRDKIIYACEVMTHVMKMGSMAGPPFAVQAREYIEAHL